MADAGNKEHDVQDYLQSLNWVRQLKVSFWVIVAGIFSFLLCLGLLVSASVGVIVESLIFSAVISFLICYWLGSQLWGRVIAPEIDELMRKKRLLKFKYGLLMDLR